MKDALKMTGKNKSRRNWFGPIGHISVFHNIIQLNKQNKINKAFVF